MRVWRGVVVGIGAALIGLVAAPAQAAPGDVITSFNVEVTAQADGLLRVRQTIDIEFAGSAHGIYLWFVGQQAANSAQVRRYTYSDITVTSPSGAPSGYQLTRQGHDVSVQVGDPSRWVRGSQTYQVAYTVAGIPNPNPIGSAWDEVFWNVIGTRWELPIRQVTVTIDGPVPAQATTCYVGDDFQHPCDDHHVVDGQARFTQSALDPGQGLAVVAGWPDGTFAQASPNVESATVNPYALNADAIPVLIIAGLLSGIAAWALTWVDWLGRDKQYAQVAPGDVPAPGQPSDIVRREVRQAPVSFAPPDSVPPRLAGAIVRGAASTADVAATIIDLVVRQVIRLDATPVGFTLQAVHETPTGLDPTEARLYHDLFAQGPSVSDHQLARRDFFVAYSSLEYMVNAELERLAIWEPGGARRVTRWRTWGIVVATVGVIGAALVGMGLASQSVFGIGYLGLPCLVFGVGLIVLAPHAPVRSPTGSALTLRCLGFREYLATAEADQLRWEEGHDIFSEYLPYAIAFGCAERWNTTFAQLGGSTRVDEPAWFGLAADDAEPIWAQLRRVCRRLDVAPAQAMTSYHAHEATVRRGRQEAERQASALARQEDADERVSNWWASGRGGSSGFGDRHHSTGGSTGLSGFSGGGRGGGVGGGGGGSW